MTSFDHSLLENKQLRSTLVPGFYKVMKKMAELSNQSLVHNSDSFISKGGGKVDAQKVLFGLMIRLNKQLPNFN